MVKLTIKQIEALRSLASGPRSPFDFGSTTVHRLCALGLAYRVHHREWIGGRERASTTLAISPSGERYLVSGA